MSDHEHQVRIHIDGKEHHSQTPTAAIDLYELGHVREGFALYKEVTGNAEDELIRIDRSEIHLVQDEHFHSAEAPENHYVIIVNTNSFVVEHEEVTFDEVVKIAFPQPPTGLDPEYTVSFEHAKSSPHFGDLTAGGKVTVKKHGTEFDVAHSNRS